MMMLPLHAPNYLPIVAKYITRAKKASKLDELFANHRINGGRSDRRARLRVA
jgi:hypothetical protein